MLEGAFVASVQADDGTPMDSPETLSRVAAAAVAGGAGGVRANAPANVAAIRSAVAVPIIGLHKRVDRGIRWITPFIDDVVALVEAGADIVAVDATERPRPAGALKPAELLAQIADSIGVPVLADIDCVEAGLAAVEAGAVAIATTLSGYTPTSAAAAGPDLKLVEKLVRRVDCPVIAEGRFATGADVRRAFDAGAHAVVVGKAISDPTSITKALIAEAGNPATRGAGATAFGTSRSTSTPNTNGES